MNAEFFIVVLFLIGFYKDKYSFLICQRFF